MEGWEPRRLDGEEKAACRGLWEQIFTEDSAAFLDYYDRWKLAENECWGIFCGGRLASMLQLNPYRMQVRGRTVESRYIVAVATAPEYRHQGMMRALLAESLKDLERRGMPFVFLMPAKEAIYRPFGFRYFYEMNTGVLQTAGLPGGKSAFLAVPAGEEDLPAAAAFSEAVLRELSGCYAQRDEHYLRMLLAELKSENGELLLLKGREGGRLCGLIPYWGLEQPEIREILCKDEDREAVLAAAGAYLGERSGGRPVPVSGACFPMEEKKPIIMGRILNMPAFLELFGGEKTEEETPEQLFIRLAGGSRPFINEIV